MEKLLRTFFAFILHRPLDREGQGLYNHVYCSYLASLRWIAIVSRLAWSLYKCVASLRAAYGRSATERPLGTIHEEQGISPWFRVSTISLRYDLSY